MLVLSRDCDSSIRIGSDIKIKVLSIRKQRVKIGVDAPAGVRIWRDEIAPSESDNQPAAMDQVDFPMLVVEDDPDQAELIVRALAIRSLSSVTVVGTGSEALDAVLQDAGSDPRTNPSLILLDLNLPDMSGRDVLRQLRQDDRLAAVPIVILSAIHDHDEVRACLAEGANAFVTKATGFEQFTQSIGRIADFWSREHCTPAPAAVRNA